MHKRNAQSGREQERRQVFIGVFRASARLGPDFATSGACRRGSPCQVSHLHMARVLEKPVGTPLQRVATFCRRTKSSFLLFFQILTKLSRQLLCLNRKYSEDHFVEGREIYLPPLKHFNMCRGVFFKRFLNTRVNCDEITYFPL